MVSYSMPFLIMLISTSYAGAARKYSIPNHGRLNHDTDIMTKHPAKALRQLQSLGRGDQDGVDDD